MRLVLDPLPQDVVVHSGEFLVPESRPTQVPRRQDYPGQTYPISIHVRILDRG